MNLISLMLVAQLVGGTVWVACHKPRLGAIIGLAGLMPAWIHAITTSDWAGLVCGWIIFVFHADTLCRWGRA